MIGRYYHTLRHLRLVQVSDRLRRKILPTRARAVTCDGLNSLDGWVQPVPKPRHLGDDGTMRLHKYSVPLFDGHSWHDHTLPRLWMYHAHYHDDLVATGVPVELQSRLIQEWLSFNPPGKGPGWEPYPVSRRIVNWLKWHLAGNELSRDAQDSLAVQADYLSRNLEFHLLGNHLLSNLKAMLFAGNLLRNGESRKWRVRSHALLVEELAVQILNDGGHFELSPMYHAVVLEDLLDLVNLCRKTQPELVEVLKPLCNRMMRWLKIMQHPDGDIAFFNDAAIDGCSRPDQLYDYSRRLGIGNPIAEEQSTALLSDSGYARLKAGHMLLLADVAEVGPACQPGHAHADTLSFELSIGSQRIVVNSGTSTYEVSEERARQRSTAAHSTLTIGQRNSSDVWAAFRTGRRARITDCSFGNHAGELWLKASHDGYRDAGGTIHERFWYLRETELTVVDYVSGSAAQSIEWYLYLHPRAVPEPVSAHRWRVSLDNREVSIEIHLDPQLSDECVSTTYHPEFGSSVRSSCLVGRWSGVLPVTLTTSIFLKGARKDSVLQPTQQMT